MANAEKMMSGNRGAVKMAKAAAKEYVDGLGMEIDNDLIKKVVANVYEWASEGKNKKEIAQYLNLSKKEYDDLLHKYPVVLGAMVKGKEFANLLLSMSLYEMALGKQTIKRQVVVSRTEYDEDGNKKSVPDTMWVEEEIPANVRFNAMKFLLENKVPEAYGKANKEKDENEYAKAFMNMSDAEKKALMLIEKHEHIKTTTIERKEAPVVADYTNDDKGVD